MKIICSLLLLFYFIICRAQTPDTLISHHNRQSPSSTIKFSFIQLTDIHIGESDASEDYGTSGFYDTLTGLETGYDVIALRSSVQWINQNHQNLNAKFVVITGDLTDSGERSEFYKAKQILDSLEIPYIPLIGNHDVWPYTGTAESTAPNGDSVINEVFETHFNSLQNSFSNWDNGTRLTAVYNPEAACTSRFQNFSFEYEGYLFLFSDFGTRVHAPTSGFNSGPGVGPEANLMDFDGGTFNWVKQKLINYPDKGDKNIFIFSHHPFTKNPLAVAGASFSYGEYGAVTEFFDTVKQHISACFAGHLHKAETYGISMWNQSETITNGIETDANKEYANGHLRINNVYNTELNTDEIDNDFFRVFPNPTTGTIFIAGKRNFKADVFEIYDIFGKKLFETEILSSNFKIDISNLNNGIYFLKSRTLHQFHKLILSKT